jgi:hypothetical protein
MHWKEQFDKEFFIEPNLGQEKHCDLCGHDHTESGSNEGYGERLKSFISTEIIKKLIEDAVVACYAFRDNDDEPDFEKATKQLRDKWL